MFVSHREAKITDISSDYSGVSGGSRKWMKRSVVEGAGGSGRVWAERVDGFTSKSAAVNVSRCLSDEIWADCTDIHSFGFFFTSWFQQLSLGTGVLIRLATIWIRPTKLTPFGAELLFSLRILFFYLFLI